MIKVSIADEIRPYGKTVLLLLDESEQRALPIWIGEFEGMQIVMGVRGFNTLRPMTFNFIANYVSRITFHASRPLHARASPYSQQRKEREAHQDHGKGQCNVKVDLEADVDR